VECVLLDVRLRDGDGLAFLRELRASSHKGIPVVMATAYGDSDRTIEAMKSGAFDYVTKPFDLPTLLATLDRALRQNVLSQTTPQEPRATAEAAGSTLVGASAAMLAVWKIIGRAAGSDAPVLVTGETGTGKEVVARAIHQHSPRGKQPFVPVNLAAVPATLIESELFGHERGAFTGAVARRVGRVEAAAGGTLFLDEIGDLDPLLQTRLLRVLQDGRYQRVGGEENLTLQARVIAATHKPVRPGAPGVTLRDDLYYRLAVIEIELPPLRARRSDVPLLVAHALGSTRARAVSESAMERLVAYSWPGNVRELAHVIQRAAAMCGGEVIDENDLSDAVREGTTAVTARGSAGDAYDGMPLRDALAALEKRLVERALERSGGNRAEAARLLGIARPQLYTKMEEHGLRPPAKDHD
ncbi:MAG: sigma-54 dependent transcriptional regulator, partial [Deltaproteobacteria bacterium]